VEANDISPLQSKVGSYFSKTEENSFSEFVCHKSYPRFRNFSCRADCGGTITVRGAHGSAVKNSLNDGFLEFLNEV
jgi:hypothetical protein